MQKQHCLFFIVPCSLTATKLARTSTVRWIDSYQNPCSLLDHLGATRGQHLLEIYNSTRPQAADFLPHWVE